MIPYLKIFLVFISLCLISFIDIYPLTTVHSWYESHEGVRYIYLLKEFRQIFDTSMFYPRWVPTLLGGYGYPTFLFYQPGIFFFLLPFSYLPFALPSVVKLALFCLFLIGGASAYILARFFGNDRCISALFAAVFLFMPYHYLNLCARGDLSELMATLLCPWVMIGMFRMRREAEQIRLSSFLLYVLSVAAVIFSHPFVALFLAYVIGWFGLISFFSGGQERIFAYRLAIGGALATLLAMPYWLPFFQLHPYVTVERAFWPLKDFFLPPRELVANAIIPWHMAGAMNIAYIALACAGLWVIRRKLLFWQIMPLFLLSLFMNISQSQFLWDILPGGKYVQFPWRIVSISSLLQYLALVQLGRLQWGKTAIYPYRAALFAIVAAGTLFQPHVSVTTDPATQTKQMQWGLVFSRRLFAPLPPLNAEERIKRMNVSHYTLSVSNEFDPKWLNREKLFEHAASSAVAAEASVPGLAITTDENAWPYRVQLHVKTENSAASANDIPYVTLHQLYFPGWRVELNGRPLDLADIPSTSESSLTVDPSGRMQIFFPNPGEYDIKAYYDGPPGWLMRNVFMIILFMLWWSAGTAFKLIPPLRRRLSLKPPYMP